MDIFFVALWAFATLWVAILVHESGHYLTGLLIGVPAQAMAIRMERPPHVALRDGEQWCSPSDTQYNDVFRSHAPSLIAAWLFVAGGFIVETLAVLVVGYMLSDIGTISRVILSTSTALFVIYIIGDWVASVRGKRPYGDVGALWTMQPVIALFFMLIVLSLRIAALVLI